MPLPAPNLDDRRFQDLVDDAKRLVQQRCPEWTDHNLSDPGVTIIEVFAWMTDQLLRRLNQVPDRMYIKFLEMIGVNLLPPAAAYADVTFWLSAPQPEEVRIAAGTVLATIRTESEHAISFTTTEDLQVVPSALTQVMSSIEEGVVRSHDDALPSDQGISCFDEVPKVGDALLIGLSNAVPSCAVSLRFDCVVGAGHGVDPNDPPLVWEALDGERWAACTVDRDETGGLNEPGDVVLHVPRTHAPSVIENRRAGWLRCRVIEPDKGQPAYGGSPEIKRVNAFTVGGTARAVNAEIIIGETLGVSEGVPGQRFPLKHRPVVPSGDPMIIDIGDKEWTEVDGFADSGPTDRHFMVHDVDGEVVFGPAVREQSGGLTRYGAVPPMGAMLVVRSYRSGGGSRGNVAAKAIKMLKSSIPYVVKVENRRAARGGIDGEDIENAKVRGPMQLRGTRAVAARDYEYQTKRASPGDIARVRCIEVREGADAGAVEVLVIPTAKDDALGRLRLEQLTPLREELLKKVTDHLDTRRVVGARVSVEPPLYFGITVEAKLRAGSRTDPKRLQDDALQALYKYFHPISGGPSGDGWAFGRPVNKGEVFWVLQRLPGVLFVEEARLFRANPMTGQRGEAVERLELLPNSVVFSHEHIVEVETDPGV